MIARIVEAALSEAGGHEGLALEILAMSLIEAERKLAVVRSQRSFGFGYWGKPSIRPPKPPPAPLDGSAFEVAT